LNPKVFHPKVFDKGWGEAPKCKNVCYHRYREMSGALCYRLRGYPSILRLMALIYQSLGNSLFFVFIKRFLQPMIKRF
jgi:hypothetical protein